MYAEHQHQIRTYAALGWPEARRVVHFVVLTIQEPLHRVGGYLELVEQGNLKPLWGNKRRAYDWLAEHGRTWWAAVAAHAEAGRHAEALEHAARCPGLGLAKAGFVLQLCFGIVGCLDTHNVRRFGLSRSSFTLKRDTKFETRLRKARRYVELCEELGGCASLWDSWCEYAYEHGKGNRGRYSGPEEVSATHVHALGL